MRHATPSLQQFVSAKRFLAHGDAIEWEELPSLADSLDKRLVNDPVRRRTATQFDGAPVSAWDNTMPADLLSITPTQPYRETLTGLVTREVLEPEVFRHFFGSAVAARRA
jgi:hypothetical protein